MSNINLHNITNSFLDAQLLSLASWRQANEIIPRDRGGPYVVTQAGYDPEDPTLTADEFVLGRSGKWISLSYFFRMSVPERRAEFVFGSAGEIMQMMSNLPSKVIILRPGAGAEAEPATAESDEMAAAFEAAKNPSHKHQDL